MIAVANEKGGVAKTTTTLTLGACLAAMNRKILLVDLDPQANLSLSLGYIPGDEDKSLLKYYTDGHSMDKFVVSTEIPMLSLITSHLVLAQVEDSKNGISETRFKEGLQGFSQEFDYVLIDCPPHLGLLTKSALVAANLLILPTQAEYFSIYALRTMMNLVKDVRTNFNSEITYKLLLTMFDKRNHLHKALRNELRDTFGSGVLATVIEVDTKIKESQVSGLPVNQYSPSSRSARQYRELAQEIETYAKAKRN